MGGNLFNMVGYTVPNTVSNTSSRAGYTSGDQGSYGLFGSENGGGNQSSYIGNASSTDDLFVTVELGGGTDASEEGAVFASKSSSYTVQTNGEIWGDAGNDTIPGTSGADNIFSFGGADSIAAGAGVDRVFGGQGSDTIYGESAVVGDTVSSADALFGGQDNDFIYAAGGNDTVNGNIGHDQVFGENGGDLLNGGQGDDILFGGNGGDTLWGDRGNDTLYGEGGTPDNFVDAFMFGSNSGLDVIKDIGTGSDGIYIARNANGTSVDTFDELFANSRDTSGGVFVDLGGGNGFTIEGWDVGTMRLSSDYFEFF